MTTKPQTLLPVPDPPEREPDDMTSVRHLGESIWEEYQEEAWDDLSQRIIANDSP